MPRYRTVSLSDLAPGTVLAAPVFDDNRTKLLHSGVAVDPYLISRLREHGVTEVQVDSAFDSAVTMNGEAHSATTQDTVALKRCSHCRAVIDFRSPTVLLRATVWRCNKCGSLYFASDEQEADLQGLTRADCNAALGVATKDRTVPTILPEIAQRLTKSLTPEETAWAGRRRHKRYPVSLPVVALPLAPDFRVNGEAMQMTTANISLGGVALLHTRFVDAPYLAIDFTLTGVNEVQVVVTVLRCRPLGLVYEIGGKFISRVT